MNDFVVAARLANAAPTMLAALLTCQCPRPINTDPDGLSLVDCMKLGHCVCNLGDAVRKATGAAP